jgi:hypothetical protein
MSLLVNRIILNKQLSEGLSPKISKQQIWSIFDCLFFIKKIRKKESNFIIKNKYIKNKKRE